MARYKYLNRIQLKVLDDLFNSEMDEQAVLEKHRVKRSTYERWLENEAFSERLVRHIKNMGQRSDILMAKYRCHATVKLVELTASDKPETSRRACLDIISAPKSKGGTEKNLKEKEKKVENLSDATASRLLAALAEEEKTK